MQLHCWAIQNFRHENKKKTEWRHYSDGSGCACGIDSVGCGIDENSCDPLQTHKRRDSVPTVGYLLPSSFIMRSVSTSRKQRKRRR